MKDLKIIVYTLFNEKYYELANITVPNKMEYCEKHNYDFQYRAEKFFYTHIGFEKIHRVLELFEKENFDILYWCGADTLITNFNKNIEDIIDTNFHFFLTKDYNDINGGVFLFNTSTKGLKYFYHIKEKMYEFASQNVYKFGEEQTAMIYTHNDPQFSDTIKILPQRSMNSYPYDKVYGHPNGYLDKLGFNGNWEKGDFIIHIPGFGPDLFHKRMEHFNYFIKILRK
jgi:hypothetical protein